MSEVSKLVRTTNANHLYVRALHELPPGRRVTDIGQAAFSCHERSRSEASQFAGSGKGTSEAVNGFSGAPCKTRSLQLAPGNTRIVERADFDWRYASGVRDRAQWSQQLESQLSICNCDPATNQFIEHRTSSGLVEGWPPRQKLNSHCNHEQIPDNRYITVASANSPRPHHTARSAECERQEKAADEDESSGDSPAAG